MNLHQYRANVKKNKVAHKKLFNKIRKKRPKNIDREINALDDDFFEKNNCLDCANCCKTTPALILNKDIDRIAKHLNLKAKDFVTQYLKIDDDDDYIYKQTPCVFLNEDNSCQIYEVRPKSCREYPHTDSNKISLALMQKNVGICPAVYHITEKLRTITP